MTTGDVNYILGLVKERLRHAIEKIGNTVEQNYAKINGDSNNKFKVAKGVSADDALRKDQLLELDATIHKQGLNSTEIKSNQLEFFAKKGEDTQLRILMNAYDSGTGFSIEPWVGSNTPSDTLKWGIYSGWSIDDRRVATISTFSHNRESIDSSLFGYINILGVSDGITARDFYSNGSIILNSKKEGVLNISFSCLFEDFGTVTLPTDGSISIDINLLEILSSDLGISAFMEDLSTFGIIEFIADLPLSNARVSALDNGVVSFFNRDFGDIADGSSRADRDVTALRCMASLSIQVRM